jgi:hypothetical protein
MAHLRPYLPTNHIIAFGPFAERDLALLHCSFDLALLLGLTGNRHLSELAHRTHEAFELLGLPLLLAPHCRTVLNLHGSCTLRKKKCCSTSS